MVREKGLEIHLALPVIPIPVDVIVTTPDPLIAVVRAVDDPKKAKKVLE